MKRQKSKILLYIALLICGQNLFAQFDEFDWQRFYSKIPAGDNYTPVVYLDTSTYPLTPYGNGWIIFNGIGNLQFARSRDLQQTEYIASVTDSFTQNIKVSFGLPRKGMYICGKWDGAFSGWLWEYGEVTPNVLRFRLDSTSYAVDTLNATDSTFHTYSVTFLKSAGTLVFYADGVLNASYSSVSYVSENNLGALVFGHGTAVASYSDPTTGALSPNTLYFRGKIDYWNSHKYYNGGDSAVVYNFNEGAGQVIYDSVTYLYIDATTPDGYRLGSHLMNGWTNARDSQDVTWSAGTRTNTDNTIAISTGLWNWNTSSAAYIGGFSNGLKVFDNKLIPTTAFNRVNVTDGVWTNNTDTASDIAQWNGTTWSKIGTNGSLFPGGSITQAYNYADTVLFVGGSFTNIVSASGDYVLKYNNVTETWGVCADGFDNAVYTFSNYNGKIIAGGAFNNSGATALTSSVAQWDDGSWSAVGTNDIGGVWALDTFKNALYAGTETGLYRLRGTRWDLINSFGGSTTIYCLIKYHNQLWYGGTNGLLGCYDGDTNSMGVTSGFANNNIEFAQYGNDLYLANSVFRILYNGKNTVGNKLFRWNSQEWSAVNYGADQRSEDLAIYDNKLAYCGDMYWMNGTAHNNICLIDVPYTPDSNPADTSTYEIETIEYYNRVTRDGGTIINLALIDSAISSAKTNGWWTAVRSWTDPEFGVKLGASDSVIKLYCLFGYDFTGTGGATWTNNSINGNPALVFNGTNDYLTQADISSGLTSAEVFIVGIRDADPPTAPTSGFWKYGSSASDIHMPYTDGNVYDDWGSTVRKTVGNPATSLSSLFLYNSISASGNFTVNLNGTQIFNTGTNTFGLKAAPFLGKSLGAYYYKGKFAGMIILNTVASSDQRTAINSFLNTRYVIY